MAFKVKDLMIDVAGVAQANILTISLRCCTLYRTYPCFCTVFRTPINTCLINATTIHYTPGGCGVSEDPTSPIYQTETIMQQIPGLTQQEITPLKEQLKAALELAEKQEAAINEQLQPKTLEDVNLLEGKLTEALAHIKAQKADLEKKRK
jgi:hypothetical protein